MFETFAHTADLGLRIRADNLEQLFAEAGRGLLAVLVANPQEVRPTKQIDVHIDSDDIEFQLFDWLSELLYRFDTEHLLLGDFDVRVTASGTS